MCRSATALPTSAATTGTIASRHSMRLSREVGCRVSAVVARHSARGVRKVRRVHWAGEGSIPGQCTKSYSCTPIGNPARVSPPTGRCRITASFVLFRTISRTFWSLAGGILKIRTAMRGCRAQKSAGKSAVASASDGKTARSNRSPRSLIFSVGGSAQVLAFRVMRVARTVLSGTRGWNEDLRNRICNPRSKFCSASAHELLHSLTGIGRQDADEDF